MKKSTRMLLLSGGSEEERKRRRYDDEGEYWIEGKYRDDRGREHYDNGRYAPMRNEYKEDSSRMTPYIQPETERTRRYDRPMNRIGFYSGGDERRELKPDYEQRQEYETMDEMRYGNTGTYANGSAKASEYMPLNLEMAERWMNDLKNEDGTDGPHWTLDQAKQVMAQRRFDCDPVDFWAALNMVYSDYSKVAKMHGVGDKIDFYADMAKAFLKDKDAQPDKIGRYFAYVAEH